MDSLENQKFLWGNQGNADLWEGTLREDTAGSSKSACAYSSPRNEVAVSVSMDTYINRQVFPQAPSPTMTSLRRISAILAARNVEGSKLHD